MVLDVIWMARTPFEAVGKTYPVGDYRGAIITTKGRDSDIRAASTRCVVTLPPGDEFDCTALVESHAIIRKPL